MRKPLMRAAVIIGVISIVGCSQTTAQTGGPAPPRDGGLQTRGASLTLFDGFEGDSVAAFWRPGNAGSGRYAAGAIEVSTDCARSGKRSVKITVREGDIAEKGDNGQPAERAELDSGKQPFSGRDLWYGFSFLIPHGFPVVQTRLIMAQWKQVGLEGGPLVALCYRAGEHYLTIRNWNPSGRPREYYRLPKITPGRWNDMVYRVRPSASADGMIEVWLNRIRVASYTGPTVSKSGKKQICSKIGLYRDRMQEPMTIYFDNYTIGDDFTDVGPSRFDGRQ